MTGFETKFFCNPNIAHFRIIFASKFSEKLTAFASFFYRSKHPENQFNDTSK
jgi:hypothetical protein